MLSSNLILYSVFETKSRIIPLRRYDRSNWSWKNTNDLKTFSILLHLKPRGYHPGEQTLSTTDSAPCRESSLLINAITERRSRL